MKALTIILIALVLGQLQLKAQDTEDPILNNSFYFNMLPFFSGTFQPGLEIGFNKSSILFYPRFTYSTKGAFRRDRVWGLGAEAQFRIYLINESAARTFFSPFIIYDYLEDRRQGGFPYTAFVSSIGGGAIVGVRVPVAKRFLIDFYGGGGLRVSSKPWSPYYYGFSSIETIGPGHTGIFPKVGIQFGFAF